ncbi:MAG: tRNA (adenosine(37)-N6)-dimethylallyltransferase MiaA [Clostridia bacterium]|nr:tRNA (adenosine(37)-N6)-dimethylallyltransferase MiaA [Clostridia bacterium]
MDKIKIAAIVGPTASGKTALSIELAKRFNGEIVSCDSMQIYRKMDIGTAKPTPEERCGIPHHLIDICDLSEKFSCTDYADRAEAIIKDVSSRGRLPILCGGTGLYLDSVLRGARDDGAESDPDYRKELQRYADTNGAEALHSMLKSVDPESARSIHPNNIRRVIRALEVFHTSGIKKSELDKASMEKESNYDALVIGLRYENRDVLYERIDKRVDLMLETGLLDEARVLFDEGLLTPDTTAGQAIGYKELFPYFSGTASLSSAIEKLKTDTRHYAKRQMTWFSTKTYVNWIPVCSEKDNHLTKTFEEIVNNAVNLFHKFGFSDIIDKR